MCQKLMREVRGRERAIGIIRIQLIFKAIIMDKIAQEMNVEEYN